MKCNNWSLDAVIRGFTLKANAFSLRKLTEHYIRRHFSAFFAWKYPPNIGFANAK